MDGFAGLMAGVARACSWTGDLVVLSLSTPLDGGGESLGPTVPLTQLDDEIHFEEINTWNESPLMYPETGLSLACGYVEVLGGSQ